MPIVTEICPKAGIAIAEARIPPYNHFDFIALASIGTTYFDADPSVRAVFHHSQFLRGVVTKQRAAFWAALAFLPDSASL